MIDFDYIKQKNNNLYVQALTHSSYSKCNYERLEFLGDSILDFVVGEFYFNIKELSEQELTRVRAYKVSEEYLSKVFDNLMLNQDIKLGKSMNCTITKAIKCDMFESIIAVTYLTFGLQYTKEAIISLLDLQNYKDTKDFKTLFQEYAQEKRLNYFYENYKTSGQAHNLIFFIRLIVENKEIASASASKKIDAEKMCAKIALEKLKK